VSDDETSPYAPSDATLRSILSQTRTIAVVGLSSKPHRDSYGVARYLQNRGYKVVPVNPKETEVLGETAYPSLIDMPTDVAIDIVDVFRKGEETPPVAEQAVSIGARVLWLQEGIVNDEARRIAEEGGLTVVMALCIRTQRARLEGE
jgi:predicted CoA-binding protein